MDSKVCVICKTEDSIDNFHNKYRECKQFGNRKSLKSYHENKDKISNQQKVYYGMNSDKSLPKQNDRYIHFKELLRNYVEYENRLRALVEKIENKYHRKQNRWFLKTQKIYINM